MKILTPLIEILLFYEDRNRNAEDFSNLKTLP